MVKRILIFLFIVSINPDFLFAEIRVAKIFSDNMVIQRDEKICIRGTAEADQIIFVDFCNSTRKTKTNKNGQWEILLPPQKAGGPYILTVRNISEKITFQNILIGDVWYASGQSNMEHPIEGWRWLPHSSIYRSKDEISDSDYPEIRLLTVSKYPATEAIDDLTEGKWQIASSQTIKSFSSTAWFFGKNLYNELNVPIGIINCTWAGTPIKAWMSKEAIRRAEDEYKTSDYSIPEKTVIDGILERNVVRRNLISYPKEGQADSIYRLNKENWRITTHINEYISDSEISWLEKKIIIPEPYAKETFTLSLGYLNRQSIVYFNGEEIGTYLYPEAMYATIPRNLIIPGENAITIRIAQPFGNTSVSGSDDLFTLSDKNNYFKCNLSDNWSANAVLDIIPPAEDDYRHYASVLYNGMVNPITHLNIKGIIWYQGEDDAATSSTYKKKFEALITDYRKKWKKKDLPFIFVQTSAYSFSPEKEYPDMWSGIREAQNISLPHTGMVVSIDLGDPYDVHPRNKKKFGERLALQALKVAYNKPILSEGPTYKSHKIINDTIIISFNHVGNKLKVMNYDSLIGFHAINEMKQLITVDAFIKDNDIYIPINSQQRKITEIRYGWGNFPKVSLYNSVDLPAKPFRIIIL